MLIFINPQRICKLYHLHLLCCHAYLHHVSKNMQTLPSSLLHCHNLFTLEYTRPEWKGKASKTNLLFNRAIESEKLHQLVNASQGWDVPHD
jgi:hypothetical protein